jgi:hypothetical protein
MTEKTLPDAFADLAPLVAEWSIATDEGRCHKRLRTDMAALKAFYDRVFPRIDAIVAYLNQFPNDPDALARPERNLFDLALMLMEAAAPIDLQWPSSDITDVFPIERFKFLPITTE